MDNDTYWKEFLKHKKLIQYILRNRLGRRDWEDLTTEVGIKGCLNAAGFDGTSIKGWFNTIARTMVIDQVRREDRLKAIMSLMPPRAEGKPVQDKRVQTKEVVRLMTELPKGQRDVIGLYMCDLGAAEIASILKIPIGSVKSRAWRARDTLTKLIEDASIGMDHEPLKLQELYNA